MGKVIDWETISHEELVKVVKYLYDRVEKLSTATDRLVSAHTVYGSARLG